MKPYKPTTLDFSHAAAFKLLQKHRHNYIGMIGLMYISKATLYITDLKRGQVLVGWLEGDVLVSKFMSLMDSDIGETFEGELFDGLCAACSSAEPVIEKHVIDELRGGRVVAGWNQSRLSLYTIDKKVAYNPEGTTLTAKIKYPT